MARVTDVFVNGSVGNIIFYRRMDKNCSRIKRTRIQQTAATKTRGANFGVASRACKALRSGLTATIVDSVHVDPPSGMLTHLLIR